MSGAFSRAALENIQETAADWPRDLAALISGRLTPAALLAHCLDGADDDRVQGWHDYVGTLAADAADPEVIRTHARYDE